MKPRMIFGVGMLAVIILLTSFGSPLGTSNVLNVPESMLGNVLYLCPAADSTWLGISKTISYFSRDIMIGLFFGAILLLFAWGWALYQNLLKDKFNQDSFKNVWAFTKLLFWALVVVTMIIYTPNHFRTVNIVGRDGDYILCESSSVDAIAVRQDAVVTQQ